MALRQPQVFHHTVMKWLESKHRGLLTTAFLFVVVCDCRPLLAQEQKPVDQQAGDAQQATAGEQPPVDDKSTREVSADESEISEEVIVMGSYLPNWAVKLIEPLNSKMSGWVDSSSRPLDSFFGTDEFLDVDNHSYLRVSEELEWKESEGTDNDIGVRFKLDLPTTKKRLKLILESNPEETRQEVTQNLNRRTATRDLGDTESTAVIGLEKENWFFPGRFRDESDRKWSNRINGGFKVRSSLDPYVRLTSEREWSWQDNPWIIDSYNRVTWFQSENSSVRSRLDLTRIINPERSMRFVTQLQWREEEDELEFYQRAEYSRVLDYHSLLRYALIAESVSAEKSKTENYYARVYFRRDLHRRIIFADVVPEIRFTEEDGFDPRWGIILRLELYFRADFVWK